MASKLAVYDTGYEDERFEQMVSQTLHCIICTNVIKDPVMCQQNEHLFCRACVTVHLMNFRKCPTCMEPLTVETLRQAPRGIRNLLGELKIRCEFYDRGCGKSIQLGELEAHISYCGFAPAVCSNDGCQLEVNKQDLIYHETAVCELRRVKCHSCNDIKREMDTVKANLAEMNAKQKKNVEKIEKKLERIDAKSENVKAVVKNVVVKVELVNKQLNKQEKSNRRLETDIVEVKEILSEITKQLGGLTTQTSNEAQDEELSTKGMAEAGEIDREPRIVVAGGVSGNTIHNTVEMFNLANGTWTQLQPMKQSRSGMSSVVHNNQLLVNGGYVTSIEKLSLNAVHVDPSICWENAPVKLPRRLPGHCSVVYNGHLIVIGGHEKDKLAYSDSITQISLVPPYDSKLLATMPQKRCYHGVAIFGDKILIVGGREGVKTSSLLKSVLIYDITKDECQELAPLPYPVCEMATVKWGDENVMIVGGADGNYQPFHKVLMYNIKTQKSYELPDMKCKRRGCVAAVVGDTVIVIGGKDEKGNYLKSVECFRFDRYSWEELPEMNKARCWPTAAVC